MTEDQLALLRDKHTLWVRASREGAMDLRDYNRRMAEALGELLAEHSAAWPEAGGKELRSAAKNARRILSDYAADAEDDTVVRAIEALDLALAGASQ